MLHCANYLCTKIFLLLPRVSDDLEYTFDTGITLMSKSDKKFRLRRDIT